VIRGQRIKLEMKEVDEEAAIAEMEIRAILDKLLEMKLTFYQWALERMEAWVDVIAESDDLGHQNSQWISLEMFRKVIKPRYARLISSLKKTFQREVPLAFLRGDLSLYS
jgi:uroporphyrinogen decarboxylase